MNILAIRNWLEAGGDATAVIAPPLEELDNARHDDLLVSIMTMSDSRPRWALTARGNYEADRLAAEHARRNRISDLLANLDQAETTMQSTVENVSLMESESHFEVRPWNIEIPDEVDPDYQHTELHVTQMGINMRTEDPWVHLVVKRERPGQHPAECLSIGITDPKTLSALIDALNVMQAGASNE